VFHFVALIWIVPAAVVKRLRTLTISLIESASDGPEKSPPGSSSCHWIFIDMNKNSVSVTYLNFENHGLSQPMFFISNMLTLRIL
jgi:hypothetical protein